MIVKKIAKSLVILTAAAGLFIIGIKLVEWMNHSTMLRLSDVEVEGNRLVRTKYDRHRSDGYSKSDRGTSLH